jgi:hypothetical protein
MSDRNPKGTQLDAISPAASPFQVSFDLGKQDAFVTSLGVDFVHYKAMPSPIGMNDRGDYRRSDGELDVISSNGMIYTKSGCFTATMVDNSKSQKRSDGGVLDYSTSRLIMPRFYNKAEEVANGDRIYLAPGDRVYLADKDADDLVPNYQRMEYKESEENRPMFPIVKIETVVDSRGISYKEGQDFEVCEGNIKWVAGGNNPGINPETSTGRVYSIRYLYKAFWYIIAIPKEVRLTNITEGDKRVPERMAYHAVVQREYIYQNQVNAGKRTELTPEDPKRTVSQPSINEDPNGTVVHVNMTNIEQES